MTSEKKRKWDVPEPQKGSAQEEDPAVIAARAAEMMLGQKGIKPASVSLLLTCADHFQTSIPWLGKRAFCRGDRDQRLSQPTPSHKRDYA
jgi:3-oxoacyl-[acyl-carrier-protein] synthase III